ncbi:phosphotransferase [Agrobacterium sp. BA1120]|uniref:phosphotransferase enzyme family protein n=1 Tax=Agrobacterium sp. BA1120 TaxID=3228927 RepID=UPI00336A899E
MLDLNARYSTPDIKDVERFINTHYPLAAPVSCKLLQRGFNDVYLVNVTTSERYVFRLSHLRGRGPAQVKSEAEFITHLSKAGVPVAAPVAARDGALFVKAQAPEGTREGILFHALEGRDPQANDAGDAWANGKTLALLHIAAETFHSDSTSYQLDLDHLLYRPLARIKDSGIVEDAAVFKDIETIAQRTAVAIEGLGDLTWTYCHGDCHGFNARINEAGEAVFFDFDDGGPGYLAYDLAVFLWAKISFGRQLTPMWHAFLGGYRSIKAITPNDFEAALRFVIVRHFWLMGEHASRAQEWGSIPIGWIAHQVHFLTSWENEQFGSRLL